MSKKYFDSFLKAMGLLLVMFFALSLVVPEHVEIRLLHFLICLTIPNHLFGFLTFNLKLFSRHLWVRRIIVMFFDALMMIFTNMMFGYLNFDAKQYWIILGISVLIFVALSSFAFYVCDKKEKQNLEEINRKLADQAENNIE